ncbi:uncharacterized protein LOC126791432 [Argentina anserina]|uniref:uncharacterized protein LOC126791432 n=1 Tax=Argentina anserina TaxID=57926 RepID=UPI002176529D|nr:uncharacterized protein LOC126791432 [Potentilla anserina]
MAASGSKNNPKRTIAADPQISNPNPDPSTSAITPSQEDVYLSRASHLTRQELLRRRAHHLKQLTKCYKEHYWGLMEHLKIQYREYYWKYGVSPLKEENNGVAAVEGGDDNHSNHLRCASVGCKLKAMALTSFCHLHILSDSKQRLYKACSYVIKSAQAGPITCGKPILRSTSPSLCTVHFQKAQKHVTRSLRKAGLNVTSSSKLAPKFHVIVAEYVRQIQSKRRAAKKENKNKIAIKEETAD